MSREVRSIISFLLVPFFIFGQSEIEPEWLSIEDGLSQGFISAIIQDKECFLWIGSKNGLNRYDGENFQIFTHDPFDPYSISYDHVHSLFDYGNFIWVGTGGGGLNIFNKRTKRFHKITLDLNSSANQRSEFIFSIFEDSIGQLWITELSQNQIFRIATPPNFQNLTNLSDENLQSIEIVPIPKNFKIEAKYLINQGDFILFVDADNHKITQINIRTLEWEPFEPQPPLQTIQQLIPLSQGKILAKSYGKSFLKEEQNALISIFDGISWKNFDFEFQIDQLLHFEKEDQSSLFIIGGGEFMLLNEQYFEEPFSLSKNIRYDIKTNAIGFNASLVDRSNIIWMGTRGYGVMKFTPRLFNIKTHFQGKSIYTFPFASRENEIFLQNPTTSEDLYIPGDRPKLKSINKGLQIYSQLVEARDGSFWTLVKDGNYFFISKMQEDGTFGKEKRILDVGNTVPFTVYMPEFHSILVAVHGSLIEYDIDANDFQLYKFDSLIQIVYNIYSFTKTENGSFWIGTSQGLIKLTPTSSGYDSQLLSKKEGEVMGLLNNEVSTLLKDPNDGNVLWIGTKGAGVHRLDTRNMNFTYLNTKNGLPNDVIYGILNDEEGNLWMSSNKGIIRYNPVTGQIKNFTEADGLQSDEFNTYAYGKSSNGTMLFGGINGLNVFHPNDLKDNPVSPNIWITGLDVNNENITVGDSSDILTQAIEFTTELRLPFSKNNITFRFAGLEYSAPSKNRYSYYLEGAEEEWAHESTDNFAPYLNLQPGNYVFKIKGANGDRVWSEQVRSLKIKILPPWYRSIPAYLVYATIIGLLIWWFLKLRENRLRLKYEIENERKEADRLKELDVIKSNFFTNISHELRTPLTIINGMTEKMGENPDKWFVKGQRMIKRNSESLLDLVNQILDLRKLESGDLKLNLIQSDIIQHLNYITESFKSYAESKDILLHFESSDSDLIMDFDPEKLLRVVSNLLSNAIKFTSAGGEIFVKIKKEVSVTPPLFNFQIKDTGIGIPENKLANIFDRFYQVDSSSTRKGEGTGIGLALTRELINLMEGEITVNSKLNEGTTFNVSFPINNNAPLKNTSKENPDQNRIDQSFILSEFEEQKRSVKANQKSDLPSLLIVEDNPDVMQYLISCLEDQFQLNLAKDGQEGIDTALEIVPDIIISDLMMPKKDGFELCQTLKTDQRTSHIPIVLLTAKADQDSRISGLERGADDYLTKPFNKKELFIRMNNLLSIRKKLQERYSSLETLAPSNKISFQQEDEFVQKVRKAIEDNLDDEKFGIAELCREVAMSRTQLHRKLKALTNRSTSLYIRSIRLQNAQELLKSTDLNISQVAFEVGFSNPNYFTRMFSEEFGFPPTDLRK